MCALKIIFVNLFGFQATEVNCSLIKYLFFLLDLCPKYGSQTEKFSFNLCKLFNDKSGIGFRASRLNHSCDPNVHCWQVERTSITVIYSSKPIRTGDEICFNYHSIWAHLSEDKESLQRSLLENSLKFQTKWGIICPNDCICKDPNIVPVIAEYSRLLKTAVKSGLQGDFQVSLAASKEKLQLFTTHPRLFQNLDMKLGNLYDMIHLAILLNTKKSINEATAFIKEFNEIIAQLEFPDSVKSIRYKMFLNNPQIRLRETIIARFHNLNDQWFKEKQ